MNEGVEPGGWARKRRAPWAFFDPFRRPLRRSNEVTPGATALLGCPLGRLYDATQRGVKEAFIEFQARRKSAVWRSLNPSRRWRLSGYRPTLVG
jgi:hypothetical protein